VKNTILILPILLIVISTIHSQNTYQPLEDDTITEDFILSKMQARFELDLDQVEGKFDNEIKEAYQARTRKLQTKLTNGHFITNPAFKVYFDDMLAHIVDRNPLLKNQEFLLLIGRYFWPNASCQGEGTIVINLGLLSRLENESQLCFVLCHELAHQYKNHVNHSIKDFVKKVHGKATNKKLKKIAKGKNAFDEAIKLQKSLLFDMRLHSRQHELEADSLALIFMKSTKYDTKESIRCLEILNEIDTPKRPELVDFKKYFETEKFTIRDRWLIPVPSTGLLYNTDQEAEAAKDSLKTHPDCAIRVKAAARFAHPPAKINLDTHFQSLIRVADFEIIEGQFQFGHYGRALFNTLLILEEAPNNTYLNIMVLDCLYQLYLYQEDHELGKVLDIPHHKMKENYYQFLSFFHNIRLRDLGKLGYYFSIKNGTPFLEDANFRASQIWAASLVLKPVDFEPFKNLFLKEFPKGLDHSEIQTLESIFKSK